MGRSIEKTRSEVNARAETVTLPDKLSKNLEANRLPDKITRTDMRKMSGIERMAQTTVIEFKCPEGLDRKEYARQLKGQERGLNKMNVDQWIKNRDAFKESGRSIEGAEVQKELRQKALQSRIETNQKNGMSFSRAKAEASKWLEGQAALHNPDQIAGGDPKKVFRMGDAKVNSSIGSQWRKRVDGLETSIKEYAKDKSPEELRNTKLNVKLKMEM